MLNICQVSLSRDIPLILDNYYSFKKLYKKFKIFIVCPIKEIDEFKKKLNFKEFHFTSEDTIISFNEFNDIFEKLSVNLDFKDEFKKRLSWYYQQILKLSFIVDFVSFKKENIIIWDADTIILKKINFFDNSYSIKYGTLFEFHKPYYQTNEGMIGKNPDYFISSLVQFIGITTLECQHLVKNYLKLNKNNNQTGPTISKIILENIFKKHQIYNGSLFSEYEFIGISNYILQKKKQKPLFLLRSGLNGKLTNIQLMIARLINVKHITYEHSHLNNLSQGMLERKQSWWNFIKIIFKDLIKFYLRNLRHTFNFYMK
jgi:hypothetical protein